jgi:flagellar biosynthesis chaperone FliJ
MPVSRALERLLGIRETEERLRRRLLDSATAELHRLESALKSTGERTKRGRERIASGIVDDEAADRIAGMAELAASDRLRTTLLNRIEAAEIQVTELRQGFFAKRIERRQAEILVDAAKAQDALDAARKGQLELDDWYRARQSKEGASHAKRENPEHDSHVATVSADKKT